MVVEDALHEVVEGVRGNLNHLCVEPEPAQHCVSPGAHTQVDVGRRELGGGKGCYPSSCTSMFGKWATALRKLFPKELRSRYPCHRTPCQRSESARTTPTRAALHLPAASQSRYDHPQHR